jgi:hypothetical protein
MLVQEAVKVTLVPTTGAGLGVVTAHESPVGGATPACQLTFIAGEVPEFVALLAITEYVRTPATADVAAHVLVALGQLTQT